MGGVTHTGALSGRAGAHTGVGELGAHRRGRWAGGACIGGRHADHGHRGGSGRLGGRTGGSVTWGRGRTGWVNCMGSQKIDCCITSLWTSVGEASFSHWTRHALRHKPMDAVWLGPTQGL